MILAPPQHNQGQSPNYRGIRVPSIHPLVEIGIFNFPLRFLRWWLGITRLLELTVAFW